MKPAFELPFELPIPLGFTSKPIWVGGGFRIGGSHVPLLEYSENFSGWSDELTALHEDSVGNSHSIDVASRHDAINQVTVAIKRPNQVLMEVGCSSGFLIKELVEFFPECIVIGAAVVREPLFRLANALPSVPLIRFDLLKNPLPKSCLDVLVMLNVLEHIEDDILALKNVYSLLKPGGSLILEVPAGSYLYDSYDAELHHFRRYDLSELRQKLEIIGFTVERATHLGFFLFPAFAIIKLLNKIGISPKSTVQSRAVKTSNSKLLSFAMRVESRFSNFFSYPFGIRVLVTAKRPC
ncbi:class I SAM-dependent methyltransferase [Polynucleobacter paneuropaeus]|nr:class I SAM-dependent methyltransferase [Polynucleobacter paneuropaeus]